MLKSKPILALPVRGVLKRKLPKWDKEVYRGIRLEGVGAPRGPLLDVFCMLLHDGVPWSEQALGLDDQRTVDRVVGELTPVGSLLRALLGRKSDPASLRHIAASAGAWLVTHEGLEDTPADLPRWWEVVGRESAAEGASSLAVELTRTILSVSMDRRAKERRSGRLLMPEARLIRSLLRSRESVPGFRPRVVRALQKGTGQPANVTGPHFEPRDMGCELPVRPRDVLPSEWAVSSVSHELLLYRMLNQGVLHYQRSTDDPPLRRRDLVLLLNLAGIEPEDELPARGDVAYSARLTALWTATTAQTWIRELEGLDLTIVVALRAHPATRRRVVHWIVGPNQLSRISNLPGLPRQLALLAQLGGLAHRIPPPIPGKQWADPPRHAAVREIRFVRRHGTTQAFWSPRFGRVASHRQRTVRITPGVDPDRNALSIATGLAAWALDGFIAGRREAIIG